MTELERAAYQFQQASVERDRVYGSGAKGHGRLWTSPVDDAYGRAVRRLIEAALALEAEPVPTGEEG